MVKFKPGDVFYDSKNKCHFVLELELRVLESFCVRMLTKSNNLYGKPLTLVGYNHLELSRFTLVGRKAVIK